MCQPKLFSRALTILALWIVPLFTSSASQAQQSNWSNLTETLPLTLVEKTLRQAKQNQLATKQTAELSKIGFFYGL
jgi:hypothetical protein